MSRVVWQRCISLSKGCTSMRQLKAIHAHFITNGLHHNNYAISKLIAFCALSPAGDLHYATFLFHQTHSPNSFIYNTLIRAHAHTHPHLALSYFNLMLAADPTNVLPDHHTFPFALVACARIPSLYAGQQIHSHLSKNGLASSDKFVQTALLRMYTDCFSLDGAHQLFDEINERDVVMWNVLINGYVQSDNPNEALKLFRQMQVSDVKPDGFTAVTSLTASARSGALQQGMWIHEYLLEGKGCDIDLDDVYIGTALVDMYAKCGSISSAIEVFEKMSERNVFSWAAMIGGFAMHGFALEAFLCFERMLEKGGVRPDGVVLLALLTACTHAGLVEKGRHLLYSMETTYGVVPKHEHYSCVVDLLCRAGRLEDALELIHEMPMKPLASVWGSLLSGCRISGNVGLAELAARELLRLDPDGGDEGAYVQLSNVYRGAQRRGDASRVRKMMGASGVRKTPGCSFIEVDGTVNEFVAGDEVHSLLPHIQAMLHLLSHYSHGHPA